MAHPMFRILFSVVAASWLASIYATGLKAQTALPAPPSLQDVLQVAPDLVGNASRRMVGDVLDRLISSELPEVPSFLARWQARELYQRDSDGLFFFVEDPEADPLVLIDITSGAVVGSEGRRAVSQLRPNRGVQTVIGSALVQFQLASEDPVQQLAALDAIAGAPDPSHLPTLRALIAQEADPEVLAKAEILLPSLIIAYARDDATRVAAIESLSGNVSLAARSVLNPLLATTRHVADTLPVGINLADVLQPGTADLSRADAYDQLVAEAAAPALVSAAQRRDTLIANILDGQVGGVPLADLRTEDGRNRAYDALVASGHAPAAPTDREIDAALQAHVFFDQYSEPSEAITTAARTVLADIDARVSAFKALDMSLDGLSLASIYFLAAIGLAITFGVMGVINMAHGEFIMLGAYTGYVVQSLVPDYTLSIVIAIPLAFALTFAAGVAMERLVIRWLYHRPLETLLATFGISIALQQIIRQIFGTQARPLTPPDWLAGSVTLNDVVSISSIRVAIIVLGAVFFVLLWLILNRTRLGLEVRAVTQNPKMASAMGINPDRINMLTFGLGSGIAGIAGVAIGLFAQVVPDLGANYIVQSFMTVVVGGVGSILGTLAGAGMIGFFQKGVEWLNPSNTLAAQTYMILFVILFIQVRPRGIIALRGRAAGD